MNRRHIAALLVVSVLVTGALVGCETNLFTRERYETLYTGLSAEDVELTLGQPYARFSNSWTYINREPFYKAVIGFDEHRQVSSMAWYDSEEMGDHPDSLNDSDADVPRSDILIDTRSGTSGTIDRD